MVSVTATWSGSYARDPVAYAPGPPAIAPLAVPVSNTAGQWLFALVSWRQDAGIAGDLQYPSTVTVRDDAGNFWIPVESGQAAASPSASPVSGIVRCAVWMAPAARQASYVFIAPTAYQSAVTALIAEIPGAGPWYQVSAQGRAFTNQGSSVTLSQTIPSGVFAVGLTTWDNRSGSVTVTATGWTALPVVTASNGANHTGDLSQNGFYVTGSGSSLTIAASGTPSSMDWADVIVVVSGVTDARAFPYSLQNTAENWPVLVTEWAAPDALNTDPVFASGTTFWAGQGGSIAASSWPGWNPWPSYQPGYGATLQLTPSGSGTACAVASSPAQAVTAGRLYNALTAGYSPGGYGTLSTSGVTAAIQWISSGGGTVSVSSAVPAVIEAGEWTTFTLPVPAEAPATAVTAKVALQQITSSGTVPASAVLYAGYCALTPAWGYEAVPEDQLTWTDISARNFTQGALEISRGIQYEQQSLEAGTMTAYLVNEDADVTFGNPDSPFWPAGGDTDVPVRLRALWPGSLTPYYPVFSGFTDEVRYGWDTDEDTWYAYAEVTASDAWSRLTQQMLPAIEQETLEDGPSLYAPCDVTGVNIAPGPLSATTVTVLPGGAGAGTQTNGFSSSAIQLPGAPGVTCWATAGTQAASVTGDYGSALAWFPLTAVPLGTGLTVEFWYSPVSAGEDQPDAGLILCTAWGGGGAMWTLWVDSTDTDPDSYLYVTVYDAGTGAATTTQVSTTIEFLNFTGTTAPAYLVTVAFTTSSLTVYVNPGATGLAQFEFATVSCNLSTVLSGYTWGGNAGPVSTALAATGGAGAFVTQGFNDLAIFGVAMTQQILPGARLAAHYTSGAAAFAGESDNWRLARIAGYSGFVPALGMRGLDLAATPAPGTDLVTGETDTNTQVVSAYYTNVASSTLAAMFVNGAGTLIYRRRMEWYDRAIGQWVLGEFDPLALSLGVNALNVSPSAAGWVAQNSATLTVSSAAAAGPLFIPYCGTFHGNGSVSGPQIAWGASTGGSGPAVTAGDYYAASCWLYSAQGWTQAVTVTLQFCTSGGSVVSSAAFSIPAMAAGSVAFLATAAARCPATAVQAGLIVGATGTPASTVLFSVAEVTLALQQPVPAGGAAATAPEVPYLPDVAFSSDRAQLYNYAVLTQYGTNLVSSFSGTGVLFTPSSGVVAIQVNQQSVAQRGQIPYTASIYLDNTVQALPYYLDAGSVEDFGNWIVQTLGSPLFRPEQVHITPAATPQALVMGLQAEVGDTVTFRRRQLGVPETQILTYLSKVEHEIDISKGQWDTTYEMSPFPAGVTLACDDVIHGVLTGGNLLGW